MVTGGPQKSWFGLDFESHPKSYHGDSQSDGQAEQDLGLIVDLQVKETDLWHRMRSVHHRAGLPARVDHQSQCPTCGKETQLKIKIQKGR